MQNWIRSKLVICKWYQSDRGLFLTCMHFLHLTLLVVFVFWLTILIALSSTSVIIGPGLGFMLGGYSLSYYVDFERIPSDKIPDIPKRDPRWIGAWWIGFLAFAVFKFVAAFLLPCLPNDPSVNVSTHVKGLTSEKRSNSASRIHGDIAIKDGFLENVKGFTSLHSLLFLTCFILILKIQSCEQTKGSFEL